MRALQSQNIVCEFAARMSRASQNGSMLAVEISSFGGPEVLRPVERPKPVAQAGEIVIRVEAAGVGRPDLLQRRGLYPPPNGASDIPGLDVAGTVESLGDRVSGFAVGERVCAIVAGGGYAEYCAAPAMQVLPIPENWTAVEAATLPENLFTVYDNLITRAQLRSSETVLIHGGTSGIGSMATMLARAWNAEVIATAGTNEKCAACLQIGAGHAVNYRQEDFGARVGEITGGRGVDVVFDMVGGSYLARHMEVLATEGRLAIVGTQGGSKAELNLGQLMIKRLRLMGSTMRIRTPEQKGEVRDRLLEEVWPLLPGKRGIRPLVDAVFPLAEAARAHTRLESGEHVGKIVLEMAK